MWHQHGLVVREVLQSVQVLRGDHDLHGFRFRHPGCCDELHGIENAMCHAARIAAIPTPASRLASASASAALIFRTSQLRLSQSLPLSAVFGR